MRRAVGRWVLLGLAWAGVAGFGAVGLGCDDAQPAAEPVDGAAAAPDVDPPFDAAPADAAIDVVVDAALEVDVAVDAEVDVAVDAAVDAGPAPRCSAPPPTPPNPVGPLPPVDLGHPGIDSIEAPAYARVRDALLADPQVHFVATWDHAVGGLIIDGGPPEARTQVQARRADTPAGSAWIVAEGELAAVFPQTAPDAIAGLDALTAAFENPGAVSLPQHDYPEGDPRVGYLPVERQSWPDPLVRLGTLFEATDAPDLVYGVWPWAGGGTGSHGGLGLLQSRSALVFSGRGAPAGVVIDGAARLVDVAPTIMAALGAPTTGGLGPDGTYADGLYLTRQDGRPLWGALDPDPCVRPDHVVLILFDGLLADELNHLALSDAPDAAAVEIPTLRALLREGTVYRHGAVVGFPSLSAPGHTTAGTGAWPGHHGVVGNGFYGRADQSSISPFDVLADLPAFFDEPQRLWDLYNRIVSGDAETLAEALHRSFAGADEAVFVAVLNEITVGGADYTPLDFFGLGKADLGETERVDALGQSMVSRVVDDARYPVPTLLQVSMLATDAAGENAGPHSPLLRQTLALIDTRIAAIRASYAFRGALDRTLFVLVSDHGMELQDPTRRSRAGAAIRDSGVATRYVGSGGVWLAQLELRVTREGDALAVQVIAHDDGQPVAEATVRCEGCPVAEVITDGEGRARLPIEGAARLTAEHPRFNPHTVAVE